MNGTARDRRDQAARRSGRADTADLRRNVTAATTNDRFPPAVCRHVVTAASTDSVPSARPSSVPARGRSPAPALSAGLLIRAEFQSVASIVL